MSHITSWNKKLVYEDVCMCRCAQEIFKIVYIPNYYKYKFFTFIQLYYVIETFLVYDKY